MDYVVLLSQFLYLSKTVSQQRLIMNKKIHEGMEKKLKDRLKCIWIFLNQVLTDKTHLFDYQINNLWLREICELISMIITVTVVKLNNLLEAVGPMAGNDQDEEDLDEFFNGNIQDLGCRGKGGRKG